MDRTILMQLVLNQLISIGLPLLVAVITTKWASSFVKATTLAGLAALSGLLNEAVQAGQTGRPYDWVVGILLALFGWIAALGVHYGYLRPTGLTDNVVDATARFGIGPSSPRRVEGRPEAAA